MTNSNIHQAEILQDRYGLRVAARLAAGSESLSHEVTERLRISRMQAVGKRKISPPAASAWWVSPSGTLSLGGRDENPGWWSRVASVLPLVLLVIGLVMINVNQNEQTARELAAVDAALLVDDLPPSAYADPGFARFIQIGNNQAQ